MDETEWAIQRKQRSQTEGLDLFASFEKRDEAIAVADATVRTATGGDALVGRITQRLCDTYATGQTFSVDAVGHLLDEAGVPRDADTRRRISGTVINRGKGKLWTHGGYTASADPRRNARPVAIWVRV